MERAPWAATVMIRRELPAPPRAPGTKPSWISRRSAGGRDHFDFLGDVATGGGIVVMEFVDKHFGIGIETGTHKKTREQAGCP